MTLWCHTESQLYSMWNKHVVSTRLQGKKDCGVSITYILHTCNEVAITFCFVLLHQTQTKGCPLSFHFKNEQLKQWQDVNQSQSWQENNSVSTDFSSQPECQTEQRIGLRCQKRRHYAIFLALLLKHILPMRRITPVTSTEPEQPDSPWRKGKTARMRAISPAWTKDCFCLTTGRRKMKWTK